MSTTMRMVTDLTVSGSMTNDMVKVPSTWPMEISTLANGERETKPEEESTTSLREMYMMVELSYLLLLGYWLGGRRHGKGTYQWNNGSMYTGEWRFDKMNGRGTIRNPDGQEYSGEFVNDERVDR